MDTLTVAFSLVDAAFFLIERSNKTREEKDLLNKAVRDHFDSLAHPSTLKDTVEVSDEPA